MKSRDMSNNKCLEYPSFDPEKENTSKTVATGIDEIANGIPDSMKVNFDVQVQQSSNIGNMLSDN